MYSQQPGCGAWQVNPLHVSVARFLLDIAGLSQVAEVPGPERRIPEPR